MLGIDILILKKYLERGIIESVEWIRGDPGDLADLQRGIDDNDQAARFSEHNVLT